MIYLRNHSIPAILDAGVFRPLEPLELAEGTQIQVQVPRPVEESCPELSPEELARQQTEIQEMLAEIESLPIEEPDDGLFSVVTTIRFYAVHRDELDPSSRNRCLDACARYLKRPNDSIL